MSFTSPKQTQDIVRTPSGSICAPITPPAKTFEPLIASNTPCLVISGPSGVGKGTLINYIINTKKNYFYKSHSSQELVIFVPVTIIISFVFGQMNS